MADLDDCPAEVSELAQACVQYVTKSVGVAPDFTLETLPLVDHYLEEVRKTLPERPELEALLVRSVGAYFGEVLRRRHVSWWRADGEDPSHWRIEFGELYLSVCPALFVRATLVRGSESELGAARGEDLASVEMDPQDRMAAANRLADLPEVSEDEYFSLAMRLEVIDIIVDAARSRRLAEDEPELQLQKADYTDPTARSKPN